LAPVAIVTITCGFTLTTQRDSVEIRAGRRFDYGEQVAGLDLAEYLVPYRPGKTRCVAGA
jgi:hypothetical protein